jgi:hypothetical protein
MTLIEEIRILLGEQSGGVFWTDEYILDAINETLIELSAFTLKKTIEVDLVVQAGEELVLLPPELMIPLSIFDGSRVFFFTTQAKLEQETKAWKGTALGVPEHFVLWDAFTIRPYPRADDDFLYYVTGIPWPTEYTSAGVDPILSWRLRQVLVNKSASVLFETTQPQLSDSLNQVALNHENEYRKELRNSQSHNIRRLHPGESLPNKAQSGVIKIGRRF